MINVGNGNLLVQSDDMSIAHKGIALAFRRTYNSMSQHDNFGADSSIPSNYGNGWTNTFDAHLAYNVTTNVMTVWDIDGTRYDYTSDGQGHWVHPAGQFAALTLDGSGYYAWTKKTGTLYRFFTPLEPGPLAGLDGRLYQIMGRNHNISLTFTYYWDGGDASSASKLNQVTVAAEDGETATLLFSNFNNIRELSSVSWPDGTQVIYGYDSSGNLTQVTGPGNNASSALVDQYSYIPGSHYLAWVKNPRQVINAADGAVYNFGYNESNQLAWVQYNAVVAPSVSDGSGTAYPGPSGVIVVRTTGFAYTSTTTAVTDTDLHSVIYTHDGIGRVTQTQAQTGSTTLTTAQGWDGSNNLAFSKDARGNETDYAYDGMGNTIAVGQPATYLSVSGANVWMRATSLYSYDSFNNIVAYCDPMWTHSNGLDWTTPPTPSDSLCPNQSGTTRYTWTPPSSGAEPYSELVQIVTPIGDNTVVFSYNPSSQGGSDFGLPTSVTGTSFTQNDGTNITPQQTFVYDSHGNLVTYSKGNGSWALAYDALNRVTTTTDPDLVTSYTTYYPNGQVKATATAYQHSLDPNMTGTAAVVHQYDADGNEISVTHHYGGTAGTAQKFYDGLERLIDVALPSDTTDQYYPISWITRYFYDLSAGNPSGVSIYGSSSFKAYGNLYKSQEWYGNSSPGGAGWIDKDGTAYDALDRVVTRYKYPPNPANSNCFSPATYASCTTAPTAHTNTYDAASDSIGLPTSTTDALGDTTHFNYDSLGETTLVTFTGDGGTTPARRYAYDPDGRTVNINSSRFGAQVYSYDADGRKTSSVEPTGGGVTSPASLTYSYYPNGQRASLSVSSSNLTQSNLMQYSYRADRQIQKLTFNYGGYTGSFNWAYSAAGRVQSRQDPTAAYSYSYNTFGQLTNYSLPAGSFSYQNYDPEGENTAFSAYNTSVQVGYTTRGELGKVFYTAGGPAGWSSPSMQLHGAWGFMFTNSYDYNPDTGPGWITTTGVPDVRAGVIACGKFNGGGLACPDPAAFYWAYDAAGRQTHAEVPTQSYCFTDPNCPQIVRYYDAENHIINQWMKDWQVGGRVASAQTGYLWGSNGHPALIGSSPNGQPVAAINSWETLHWDGDTLLFTTNSQGGVDDVKVGMLADYTPADPNYIGMTVWDRDGNGQIASSHNTTGHGPLLPPNAYGKHGAVNILPTTNSIAPWPAGSANYVAPNGFTTGNSTAQGGYLFSQSTDGYSDYYNTIQGVRAYDPVMQGWTTLDAYAGTVHDPASQKPYTYNRNNPVEYADPSGFIVVYTNDYIRRLVEEMEKGSPIFHKRMDILRTDTHTYTFSAQAKTAEGHGGSWNGGTSPILIDMSQAKGLIEGQIAHEATHAWHQSLDAAGFNARLNAPVECHGACSGFSGPVGSSEEHYNQEEQLTYNDAHPISEQDPSVQWYGPDWQTAGVLMDWNSYNQYFGTEHRSGESDPLADFWAAATGNYPGAASDPLGSLGMPR